MNLDFDKPLQTIDYETHLLGTGPRPNLPPPVVLSVFDDSETNFLVHRKDPKYEQITDYLLEPGHILCGHNIAFDLGVMWHDRPELATKIFDKLENCEVYDTLLAEKLLNLTTVGVIETGFVRGKPVNFRYDLGALVYNWLGQNISEDKKKPSEEQMEQSKLYGTQKTWTREDIEDWDLQGAWRLRYADLDNFVDTDLWPSNARRYALADTELTAKVAYRQIAVGEFKKEQPFKTLPFQIMKDFAFGLMTSIGVKTDQEKVAKIKEWVDENLTEEILTPIREAGIYIPAHNGKPYKNNPEKFTKPEKACLKQEPLKRHIANLLKDGIITKKEIFLTDSGANDEEFKEAFNACVDDTTRADLFLEGSRIKDKQFKGIVKQTEVKYITYMATNVSCQRAIQDLDIKDAVFDNFIHYKEFCSLRSNEIPRMQNETLYPTYDCLKVTGRSSSKGTDHFPSCNIQQIDGRIREAYTARPGYKLLSLDYKSMELITAAQTCYNLFGYSKLMEVILKGYDSHAYLGAQIAYRVDDMFREHCKSEKINKPEDIYKEFFTTKGTDFFKKYRSLAKPVGLGFWGGLGFETFIKTAKNTYYVTIKDEAEAKLLKNIWHEVFPETEQYFAHVRKHAIDHPNCYKDYDDEGKLRNQKRYKYVSPYGMFRSNCKYTQIANGWTLQTPGSEGSCTAVYMLMRHVFDPSLKSILYGGNFLPAIYVHDEFVGDVKEGMEYEVAVELDRIMRKGFELVCPNVPIETDPALMTHWNKKAESIIDHKKKTISLWTP